MVTTGVSPEERCPRSSGELTTLTMMSQFSKMSDRQMMLWDTTSLTNITTETIDSSSCVVSVR